jgi:hypothetical protein
MSANLGAETCLECHDDATMTLDRNGEEISLFMNESSLEGTAHDGFANVNFDITIEAIRALYPGGHPFT